MAESYLYNYGVGDIIRKNILNAPAYNNSNAIQRKAFEKSRERDREISAIDYGEGWVEINHYDKMKISWLDWLLTQKYSNNLSQYEYLPKKMAKGGKVDDNAGNMYMLGDEWNSDFDYDGMLMAGINAKIEMGAEKLEKLHHSFQDVNYHTQGRILWDAIKLLKAGDTEKAKEKLAEFNRSCEVEMTGEEKFSKGGQTVKKKKGYGDKGMIHALLHSVDASTIGYYADLSDDTEIEEVRDKAIEALREEGDELYVTENGDHYDKDLHSIIRGAAEMWRAQHEYSNNENFAKGGGVNPYEQQILKAYKYAKDNGISPLHKQEFHFDYEMNKGFEKRKFTKYATEAVWEKLRREMTPDAVVGSMPTKKGDIVKIKNPYPDENPNQLWVVVERMMEEYGDKDGIKCEALGTGLTLAPISTFRKNELAVEVPSSKVENAHKWMKENGGLDKFARGGSIKVDNRYGDWTITYYEPITYTESGASLGGRIKLTNQKTFDAVWVQYDHALRSPKWWVSYSRVRIEDKSPKVVIEKLAKVEEKFARGGSVSTFADLKRKLTKGQGIKLVFWFGQTPDNFNSATPGTSRLGRTRYIVKVQTNGVYFSDDANATTGSYWEFPPASLVEVSNTGFKVYGIGTRPYNAQEQAMLDNEPKDEQQSYIDAISDGSTMYYRKKSYYESAGFGYLMNGWEKGLYRDFNNNNIKDKSIKGALELEYKFVDEFAQGGAVDDVDLEAHGKALYQSYAGNIGKIIDKVNNLIAINKQPGAIDNSAEIYNLASVIPYSPFSEQQKNMFFAQTGIEKSTQYKNGGHISNADAESSVAERQPFLGSNLDGKKIGNAYVVFSYGYYPIFVYYNGQWYENADKYSSSTAKQMGQVRPTMDTIKKSTEDLTAMYEGRYVTEIDVKEGDKVVFTNRSALKGVVTKVNGNMLTAEWQDDEGKLVKAGKKKVFDIDKKDVTEVNQFAKGGGLRDEKVILTIEMLLKNDGIHSNDWNIVSVVDEANKYSYKTSKGTIGQVDKAFINDRINAGLYEKGGIKGYRVWNETDGIYASPELFKTREEATAFANQFLKRFEQQGYYLNSRGEMLLPREVDIMVTQEDDTPLPFENGGDITSPEVKKLIKNATASVLREGYDVIAYKDKNGLAFTRLTIFLHRADWEGKAHFIAWLEPTYKGGIRDVRVHTNPAEYRAMVANKQDDVWEARSYAKGGGVEISEEEKKRVKGKMNIAVNIKTGNVYVGGVKPKNILYKDEKGYYIIDGYGKFLNKKYPIKKYFTDETEIAVLRDYLADKKYAKGGAVSKKDYAEFKRILISLANNSKDKDEFEKGIKAELERSGLPQNLKATMFFPEVRRDIFGVSDSEWIGWQKSPNPQFEKMGELNMGALYDKLKSKSPDADADLKATIEVLKELQKEKPKDKALKATLEVCEDLLGGKMPNRRDVDDKQVVGIGKLDKLDREYLDFARRVGRVSFDSSGYGWRLVPINRKKKDLSVQEINENSKSLITVEDFNFEKDENVYSKNSAELKNDHVSNIPFSQRSIGYSDK